MSNFEVNIRENTYDVALKEVGVTYNGLTLSKKFRTYFLINWRIERFVKKAKRTLKNISGGTK
jgi:hypothetical protein